MANETRRGFRWHSSRDGGKNPPIRVVSVASAYGTVLAAGDALKYAADGSVARAAAGDALICGVMVSVKQYWDGTYRQPRGTYLPVSTWGTDLTKQSLINMIPVTGQVFEVDADDAVTATTFLTYEALINENCDHIVESGSLNQSYMALDISTHAITSAQWQIIGISKKVNHDFASVRVKLLVTCNESEEAGFTLTRTA